MLTASKEGNKLKIYINGVLNEETSVTNDLRNVGRDLIIGGIYNNGNITQFLSQMTIDDLKIRNYALTPEQIKTEYTLGNKPTLLVHYVDEKGETLIPSTKHTTDVSNTPFAW